MFSVNLWFVKTAGNFIVNRVTEKEKQKRDISLQTIH